MTAMRRTDRVALARAIEWAKRYQRGKPIILLPEPVPRAGSPEWIEEARRCAACAQMLTLGLRPWQCPPVHASDTVGDDRYGERPAEVELRQRMIKLGISIFEPDPLAALAAAEAERVS
jgi:hypothetical protein